MKKKINLKFKNKTNELDRIADKYNKTKSKKIKEKWYKLLNK